MARNGASFVVFSQVSFCSLFRGGGERELQSVTRTVDRTLASFVRTRGDELPSSCNCAID